MILKKIQSMLFRIIYFKSRIFMSMLGVKFGHNVEVFSIASFSSPNKLSIGDNVWIGKNVSLYAESGIVIGDNTMIAKDVSIISSDHNFFNPHIKIREQGMKLENESIVIGENVWIGEKAIILKRVKIGNNSIIGAGAVVTKDIPNSVVVAGNPARIIKYRK